MKTVWNSEADVYTLREDSPCVYIEDGRQATFEYLFTDGTLIQNFHLLLARGYRRWGNIFYRNICMGCSSCVPIRIRVDSFEPSKSQRRTLRMNSDIRMEIAPARVTQEKLRLYLKYLSSKHDRSEMDEKRSYESLLALHYGYPFIREMDYFAGDELIAVGIVDEAEDALSSNYFYYDTAYLDRRPGIFSILREIAAAASLGKKYYYLGFLVEETPKMSYKKDFRPNEIFRDGKWREYI